jgi:hypothetical protein
LLKQKVAQKVAIILGYFMFKKNQNEPLKVAQLAKICPIWSPWSTVTARVEKRSQHYVLLAEACPGRKLKQNKRAAFFSSS